MVAGGVVAAIAFLVSAAVQVKVNVGFTESFTLLCCIIMKKTITLHKKGIKSVKKS